MPNQKLILSIVFSFRDTWSDHPNRKSESYDSSFNDDVKSDYEEKPRKAEEFEKRADFESNVAENTVEQRKVPPPPPPQASNNALRPKVRAEPKKIDLGAAALYAKQHQPENSRVAPSSSNKDHNTDLIGIDASASSTNGLSASGNLLTDLFGELTVKPTADIFGGPTASTATSNGNHADNFADFSQFDSANSNADDFTDFQSAFASPASASGASSLLNSDSSHPFSSNANSFAAMNPFMSQPQAPNNTASQLIMPQLLSPTPLVPVSSVGNLPKNNTADECTPATSAPHKIGQSRVGYSSRYHYTAHPFFRRWYLEQSKDQHELWQYTRHKECKAVRAHDQPAGQLEPSRTGSLPQGSCFKQSVWSVW